MLTEESLNNEYATYVNSCNEIGVDIESIVTSEKLIDAPAGMSSDTGNAFRGGLVMHCNLTYQIAKRIAKMISNTFHINEKSLAKVCLLSQIAKTEMFIPTDEEWQKKRGILYKFAETPGVLKVGERSALMVLNAGIQLTPIEFEAFRVLDKDGDELKSQKYVIDILSTVVKQANELAYAIEKEHCKN